MGLGVGLGVGLGAGLGVGLGVGVVVVVLGDDLVPWYEADRVALSLPPRCSLPLVRVLGRRPLRRCWLRRWG